MTAAPVGSHFHIFLCGDVMTGRGIDQILPHPGDPKIHEQYVRDARRYVDLAEEKNGLIPKPVDFSYIWGDALLELKRAAPHAIIANLETSITGSSDYYKGKGINYRMNPANIACLSSAGIDVCALANNHVLDWERAGLSETLRTLKAAGIRSAGAGSNLEQSKAPAVVDLEGKGRILVFSCGHESSGIPSDWGASTSRAGINLLHDLSPGTVHSMAAATRQWKRPGDIVVASIHWGDNWGYRIPEDHIAFAHQLIDDAGVDVVHGHSSHHAKAIEVYRGKAIIYGCGDFINDYEGIVGYESFRGDLGLMYFLHLNSADGTLAKLRMVPTQTRRLRVRFASAADAEWLRKTMNREGKFFGTSVDLAADNSLILRW